jgi:spore germination cell wall hydrolase CwlJ-like protein
MTTPAKASRSPPSGGILSFLCGLLAFHSPGVALTAASYDQRVIAAVIAGEASDQGHAGMAAVAQVIRQRVLESGWTPLEVVTHGNGRGRHAFSCLNGLTLPGLVKKWHLDSGYPTALELARLVCDAPEQLPNTTRRANFFTRRGEQPAWARGREPVVIIKDRAFYQIPAEPGAKRAW